MDAQDAARRAREEAYNSLESSIYSSRDLIFSSEVETVTTEEQREEYLSATNLAQEWLDEHGFDATTEKLREQLQILNDFKTPILYRRKELRERPTAFAALRNSTATWAGLLQSFKTNATNSASIKIDSKETKSISSAREDSSSSASAESSPSPSPQSVSSLFSDAELESALKAIADAKKWLESKEAEQADLSLHVAPVVTAKEITQKKAELDREIMKVLNKPTKIPPKPKTSSSASKTATKTAQKTATTPLTFEFDQSGATILKTKSAEPSAESSVAEDEEEKEDVVVEQEEEKIEEMEDVVVEVDESEMPTPEHTEL